MRQVRRWRLPSSQDPHSWQGGRDINMTVLPEERGVQAPHWTPQPRSCAPGRRAKQLVLKTSGVYIQESWRAEGVFKNPFTLSSSREAGRNWNAPGNTDAGGCHFCKLILLCGHWHWEAPFWNPPSSLLPLGTAQSTRVPIAVVSHQVPQSAMPGACPTHQCAHSIKLKTC